MKLAPIIMIHMFCLAFGSSSYGQACNCSISEVETNTVTPCDLTIGAIVTVSTTAELRTAIIEANDIGGNMTILIADGTYQIASTAWFPYITASNVVFRSLTGNRDAVILRGAAMTSVDPLVESGFYIVGDHITIADLTIMEVGNHGIACEGDFLYVHNVKIQNTYEQMIKGTSAGDGADNGRVQCSLLEYTAGVGPQYYIGGLDIHEGSDWVVSDNIFRNIASPGGSLAEHAVHFWNSSSDNTIERNMIFNCDRGIGFGLGSSPSSGGIIRNNMIYNDGSGLFDDVGIGLETSPGTKVYNNTIYIDYPNAIEYRFQETTEVEIANNLTNKLIRSRDGGQANLLTNYSEALESWFENLSSGDLRLNYSIPTLVDQGTNLSEVTMDLDQTPRPLGSSMDIGAYEYGQVSRVADFSEIITTFTISPNPAVQSVTIESTDKAIVLLEIYNSVGTRMLTKQMTKPAPAVNLDISHWSPGIYFCKVLDSEQKPEVLRMLITN